MGKILRCDVCGTVWQSKSAICPKCNQIDTTKINKVNKGSTKPKGRKGKLKQR